MRPVDRELLRLAVPALGALLADTPLMGNLMRCRLEAMIRADGGALPPFCFGLVDQVASIMTAVMDVEPGRGDLADMSVLADLLAMSDDIFAWLADEVHHTMSPFSLPPKAQA